MAIIATISFASCECESLSSGDFVTLKGAHEQCNCIVSEKNCEEMHKGEVTGIMSEITYLECDGGAPELHSNEDFVKCE